MSLCENSRYAEGRYEIMDGSDHQLVFRLGFRF
jgi:hypothetical protein